ncbi:transglutaminase family protein [Leifsonia shinshuensis]|uniref:transglutaminase family protein n=1 Tax=Leifsonia shinshuensis TaxID=150026 RepID=UPI001F5070DF|nr:transglutaminase family protein [Leifsonia shinshuensis]MCI0157516.1 transglutaminase family protein [Leifsonia shinshuensis]
MKRLRVTHSTGYRYGAEVSASYNEARMLPVTGERQLVLHSSLDVQPVSSHHQYTDYWGTRVLAFDVLNPHRELTITATSLVEVLSAEPGAGAPGRVGPDREELAATVVRSGECVQQLRQTLLTDPPASLVALAAEAGAGAAGDDPCATAHAIAVAAGAAMTYESGVTGVRTTAREAWESRGGVCQDIAHVAIGALRSAGIPARYVSGYLHPKADAAVGETVVGESHAWVEWFCGEWHGYDPTNGIEIGDRHVRVGHGRDYTDVAPLRGVYSGAAESELFVSVSITREA